MDVERASEMPYGDDSNDGVEHPSHYESDGIECIEAMISDGTAHEGLDRLRAEAMDYELMGEEFTSISCSQLLAWVFDALAEREELRNEVAYLRRERGDE